MDSATAGSILVRVTQADIDAGKPLNCTECAIAQALHRQFPLALVQVYPFFCKVDDFAYLLPGQARAFQRRSDRGLSVRPFEFWMPPDLG